MFPPDDPSLYSVISKQPGPAGALPITPEDLLHRASGDIFGWTQDVGMGWQPAELRRPEALILSTQGGVREPDGTPLALGYHTGHWEVGLLVRAAAETLRKVGLLPFAGFVTDPCDGRTQGTTGMMDSLPYRNDAALVLRRLIRSLPTRRAVIGIATCDKGLPAMLMALAACHDMPAIAVPGGVTLPPTDGVDAGAVQTIGARYAYGQLSLEEAAELGCRACASPGGGCQFLGTAATSQVVAEALGLTVPHAALAPSGQPIWTDVARRSARAAAQMIRAGTTTRDVLTDGAIRNAMTVHAAFGGSTNLLLHVPAIAHAAGLRRPVIDDWLAINRQVPRLVDVLPNGPHPTVRVYLAGGVPEVMLHLRRAGLLDTSVKTVSGETLDTVLDWWETSERRTALRARLLEADGVDADAVILAPDRAAAKGLTATVCFIRGNLAPEGAICKSTAIDPIRRRQRRGVSAHWPCARLHQRARCDCRHQESRRRSHQCRRGDGAHLPRTNGRRNGGGLPGDISAEVPPPSASRWPWSPTRASLASRPAPASATSAQKRWPAVQSGKSATAIASPSSSTAPPSRAGWTWLTAPGARDQALAPPPCAATCTQTPTCQPTRDYGRPCKTRAGGLGEGACTTSTRLFRDSDTRELQIADCTLQITRDSQEFIRFAQN